MIRLKTYLSQRSPLSLWRLFFRVRVSVCWKVLSTATPQSSCHEAGITVKILFLAKQMRCCRAQGGAHFSLIAHLSQGRAVARHFGHLKLFAVLSFLFFDRTIFCLIHQSGASLILLHHSWSCNKHPLTLINNPHLCFWYIFNPGLCLCIVTGVQIDFYISKGASHLVQICTHRIKWIHKNLSWWHSCYSDQLKTTSQCDTLSTRTAGSHKHWKEDITKQRASSTAAINVHNKWVKITHC